MMEKVKTADVKESDALVKTECQKVQENILSLAQDMYDLGPQIEQYWLSLDHIKRCGDCPNAPVSSCIVGRMYLTMFPQLEGIETRDQFEQIEVPYDHIAECPDCFDLFNKTVEAIVEENTETNGSVVSDKVSKMTHTTAIVCSLVISREQIHMQRPPDII